MSDVLAGVRVTITLPVPPSANRWWRHVGHRVLLSRDARAYRETVAGLLLVARVRMIRPPTKVSLRIVWYRERKSGDLDKRLGILLDSLQALAYENDAQVVELYARREEDPLNPRIELEVTAL